MDNTLENPFAALRQSNANARVNNQHKLRIPDFYIAKPRLWFIQLEAQFDLANILDDRSRFFHVIASLPAEVASRIDFLIENPPDLNKYQALKEALLSAYEKSPLELCSQALTMASLGDRAPSQLMSDLIDLIPRNHKTGICPFVIALFIEKLPADIRLCLNIENVSSYEILANQADALMARRLKSNNINHVQNFENVSNDEEMLEINNVNRNFNKKKFDFKKKSTSSTSKDDQNKKCWYHEKFGSNATKCVKPCVFFQDQKN